MRDELGRYTSRCEAVICPSCGEPMPGPVPEEVLELGDVRLDVARREVRIQGELQGIPRKHGRVGALRLLAIFMRRPGRIWSRDSLMTELGMWDHDANIISVYVCWLRQIIRPSRNVRITTVGREGRWSVGTYTLELVEEVEK